MFQDSGRETLSLMLSEVLHDIGVNENTVMRMRRRTRLMETMHNIIDWSTIVSGTTYNLGSISEGTTTLGLHSDNDILLCLHDVNIMQDWSDWERGKLNYLMIHDENTTPGYCFLQLFKPDEPHPLPGIPLDIPDHITYKSGTILVKNTLLMGTMLGAVINGPSTALQGLPGFCDIDHVSAFPCKSWLKSASGWLKRQGIGRWPTQDIKRNAASAGFCVVPTGSKVSKYPELEWRISTSVAERCLMADLNITQIRCYVLLKMILKSFLNPQGEINISSFMCKTVLLHCIENKEPHIWKENNLFPCLTSCLLELHSCVQKESCSHFIIQENNLMAGQFTAETKHKLSKNITEFLQNGGHGLLRIEFDDLGRRLQAKQNMVPLAASNFPSFLKIYEQHLTTSCVNIARQASTSHVAVLLHLQNQNIRTIKQYIVKLMTFSHNGNRTEHDAYKFQAPFIFTTYGSVLASASIAANNQVSPDASAWLSAGLYSDISSGRLKFASILYSTGDMEKAEQILIDTEQQCNSYPVLPICGCREERPARVIRAEFKRVCGENTEDYFTNITAFCVRFIQKEINCVPRELQYEMFRSTQDDKKHRHGIMDCWMEWAVVDSLPFLYFLQYKIYRHLQKHQNQQQALCNLIRTIETDKNLGHRETALNILGQCMEQENRFQQALNYYLLSLQQRAKNNVAIIHICKLLSRLLTGQ